jgi:hypothetical protein
MADIAELLGAAKLRSIRDELDAHIANTTDPATRDELLDVRNETDAQIARTEQLATEIEKGMTR